MAKKLYEKPIMFIDPITECLVIDHRTFMLEVYRIKDDLNYGAIGIVISRRENVELRWRNMMILHPNEVDKLIEFLKNE